MFKVRIRDDASGRWLENSIRFSVSQADGSLSGREAVLAKLSEVLFVETLRGYIAGLPPEETGWLAGARDSDVAKTLALIRCVPLHPLDPLTCFTSCTNPVTVASVFGS